MCLREGLPVSLSAAAAADSAVDLAAGLRADDDAVGIRAAAAVASAFGASCFAEGAHDQYTKMFISHAG